jgi:amino acid permease
MSNQAPSAHSRRMNIFYGIANLANYIVGAGILGLSFVFSKTGWAVGCFLILLAAFATSLSFDFLLQASASSGCYSYDALALRTGGIRLQKVRESIIYKLELNMQSINYNW